MDWIQENIECLVSAIAASLVGGGIFLYRKYKRNHLNVKQNNGRINQNQIGGDNSTQIQIGEITNGNKKSKRRR